ncbi:MAG: hypothetical protein JWL84_2295 [Rhodospirillales bacterium]|nr:hypothetical protein [Rhodospirillales bacterium]
MSRRVAETKALRQAHNWAAESSVSGMQRLMQLTTASLGPDECVVEELEGSEGLSQLFSLDVGFRSARSDLQASDILGKPATLELDIGTDRMRPFNGIVRRFRAGSSEARGERSYRIEIAPALWFLSAASDCRIFETKTVLAIIEAVLSKHRILYDSSGVKGSRAKSREREYCVQYRETDLAFVSRLMEEEGIFYFFQHAPGKHTLVLADNPAAYLECPQHQLKYSEGNVGNPLLSAWVHGYEFFSGKWAQSDYNFKTPSTSLLTSTATRIGITELSKFERFDYPGNYSQKSEDGEILTRLRMEEEEAAYDTVRASGFARSLFAGGTFELTSHSASSEVGRSYAVTTLRHVAVDRTRTSGGTEATDYRNEFVAIPSSTVFRPQRLTPKPMIHGLQTATVTGPSGQEIFTDKYGRVQVIFHWDRQRSSSCWIRVASSIAGKGWGVLHLPRIGQEVVVSFIEGDPDRPIVTGSVYNEDNMPPYTLPDNRAQSGFRSRSTLQGGAENFNELRFEDKKGEEQVYLHAERDFVRSVENDDGLQVGNDQTIEIKNNRTEMVKQGNDTVTVETGNRLVTVKGGNDTHEIETGNRAVKIEMGSDTLTISTGNRTTKLSLGKSSTEAMQAIEFTVGQSSIKIDQAGVTISGLTIKIEGQLQTQLKGLMTQINGDGMLQLKGGITMIG